MPRKTKEEIGSPQEEKSDEQYKFLIQRLHLQVEFKNLKKLKFWKK